MSPPLVKADARRPLVVAIINQVPDLTYLRIDPGTGEIDLDEPDRVLHPNDRQPVESALRVKDADDAQVLVMAVDRQGAEEGIREALSMGADEGLLLSSGATRHSDALARANLLAHTVRHLPRCDAVFVGTETMEPDWSTVGGAIAAILDWNLVPGGREVRLKDGGTHGVAMYGAAFVRYKAAGPAVVTVRPDTHKPRWPTTWGVRDAYRDRTIQALNLTDLEIDGRMLARMASLTETRGQRVVRERKKETETFTDPPEVSARVIGKRLARDGYLGGF
ncbi:MAG: hypothetical protein KY455_12070 [Euryarchaeota archaeon]|nr:hypothetical protein [Euryarchaeota archaeon]